MRIILYTGKGGVGKTSIAAATALKCAREGQKTLVLSTDPAHSLGDSLGIKLSAEAIEIEPRFWAQEIDAIHEVEKGWGTVQAYLTELFTSKTVKNITTEELTVFPGMEDLLSLLRILGYYKASCYDVIIIDCAPTGETLALLSFPEMLRWWMDKLFPFKRKALKVVKPVVEPLVGIPLPSDSVMGELEQIYNQLDEMRQIFANRDVTSIRIVVNPEKMVIKEAQRSFTYLNIYDFNVDAVIVNRVMPNAVTDTYFSTWKAIQAKYKDDIRESFSPVPILEAPLFETEIVGLEMLQRLSEAVFSKDKPSDILYSQKTQHIEKVESGYIFSLYMPFTSKGDVNLNLKGDELIVRMSNLKRCITLPRTLQGRSILSAKFIDDTLCIHFGRREDE